MADEPKVCCPDCFAFPWLKQYVQTNGSPGGNCSYCHSRDVPVLEVRDLEPYFQNLMAMYERYIGEPFTHGEPLIDKVQLGWNVFDEDEIGESAQKALLEDILNSDWDDDDGDDPIDADDDFVSRGAPWHESEEDRWSEFCWRVRQDPNADIRFAEHILEDLSSFAVQLPAATEFHRARLGCERNEDGDAKAYVGKDAGPPPAEKAVAGRGNRAGQVVLYCATDRATAVAEVRPAKGLLVSVCKVSLSREVRILDLTSEPDFNPFISENAQYEFELLQLLMGFAEEMSRPLERTDDHSHYVPCQKLCDYLASNGFDGVRYRSALHDGGINVLIFDHTVGVVGDSQLIQVRSWTLEFEELS